MEGGGIEICAVGPDEGVDFWVESDLGKDGWVTEWAEEFSAEDGLEVDGLLHAVVKVDAERDGCDDLEACDAAEQMRH